MRLWLRARSTRLTGGVRHAVHAACCSFQGAEAVVARAHEAGFDAFMTGFVFASLLRIAQARP
jgi:hypothetical protein